METKPNSSNRQIARAAGTIMFAYILSNVVGLIRQVLVSNTFGTNFQLDAFYAAVTIPDLLFNLLAGGALASAFIPIFTDVLNNDEPKKAFDLSSAVISLILIVLGFGSLLVVYFAPNIVRNVIFLFKPELDPALQQLTIDMLRIIMIAPTIFGVSGIVMGILNTHHKYLVPALAPVVNWAGWILGLLLLVPRLGIFGLAWGYVLGAVFHLGIQVISLIKLDDFHFNLKLDLSNVHTLHVLKLVGPRLFGVGAVQVNFLINTMLATSLGEGSLSAINVGRMIMTMPLFVIAQAIATAALPTFSAQVSRNEKKEMIDSLTATLRGVLLLSIPATIGLIVLRSPITVLLFQRGKFDAHSTELVSWAILWYTAGLVGHAIVEILSRAFYALHDTKTPVTIGILAMGLNVGLSFGFVYLFNALNLMPHGGLALANSAATAIEAVILLFAIRKPLGGLKIRELGMSFLHFFVASGIMGFVIWLWMINSNGFGVLAQTVIAMFIGGIVYLVGLTIAKTPEIQMAIEFSSKAVRSFKK